MQGNTEKICVNRFDPCHQRSITFISHKDYNPQKLSFLHIFFEIRILH